MWNNTSRLPISRYTVTDRLRRKFKHIWDQRWYVPIKIHDTNHHGSWGKEDPTEVPEAVWPYSHHLVHTFDELVSSEDPWDGDGLEEADPEQAHSWGWVEVHQLEDVRPSLNKICCIKFVNNISIQALNNKFWTTLNMTIFSFFW